MADLTYKVTPSPVYTSGETQATTDLVISVTNANDAEIKMNKIEVTLSVGEGEADLVQPGQLQIPVSVVKSPGSVAWTADRDGKVFTAKSPNAEAQKVFKKETSLQLLLKNVKINKTPGKAKLSIKEFRVDGSKPESSYELEKQKPGVEIKLWPLEPAGGIVKNKGDNVTLKWTTKDVQKGSLYYPVHPDGKELTNDLGEGSVTFKLEERYTCRIVCEAKGQKFHQEVNLGVMEKGVTIYGDKDWMKLNDTPPLELIWGTYGATGDCTLFMYNQGSRQLFAGKPAQPEAPESAEAAGAQSSATATEKRMLTSDVKSFLVPASNQGQRKAKIVLKDHNSIEINILTEAGASGTIGVYKFRDPIMNWIDFKLQLPNGVSSTPWSAKVPVVIESFTASGSAIVDTQDKTYYVALSKDGWPRVRLEWKTGFNDQPVTIETDTTPKDVWSDKPANSGQQPVDFDVKANATCTLTVTDSNQHVEKARLHVIPVVKAYSIVSGSGGATLQLRIPIKSGTEKFINWQVGDNLVWRKGNQTVPGLKIRWTAIVGLQGGSFYDCGVTRNAGVTEGGMFYHPEGFARP